MVGLALADGGHARLLFAALDVMNVDCRPAIANGVVEGLSVEDVCPGQHVVSDDATRFTDADGIGNLQQVGFLEPGHVLLEVTGGANREVAHGANRFAQRTRVRGVDPISHVDVVHSDVVADLAAAKDRPADTGMGPRIDLGRAEGNWIIAVLDRLLAH